MNTRDNGVTNTIYSYQKNKITNVMNTRDVEISDQ